MPISPCRRRWLNQSMYSAVAISRSSMFFQGPWLRWGELAALQCRDIDPVKRRITVRRSVTEVSGTLHWGQTKNSEHCEVPVPTFLVDQLRFAIKDKAAEELVFTAARGGVLRYRNARRWWDT